MAWSVRFRLVRPARVALAVGLLSMATSAPVESKPAAADLAKPVPLPADAIKRLKSGDLAQVKSALDDVRTSAKAGAPAVPAIVELIQKGLSPSLTQAAVETLADTESETASAGLAWYARHRNAVLRRAAVQALARTRGPIAIKMLRVTLSDPDPAVRGLSATGLGTMKAKEAIGDLFVALEHKVAEASASIGQLCAGGECDRLAAKLGGGSLPFEVVTSGLDQALFRGPPDVSDDNKVKIIARVRELGTGEANRFLRDVQSRWPKGGSPRVRQALDQAVLATSGSPGAGVTERSQ
jgi:HEAT repeat protein